MMGIFLTTNKKYSWTALLFAVLMGITRMYIVVHYPTDIIGGLIAGAIGGALGFAIAYFLYRFLQAHKENKVCHLVLEADPVLTLTSRIFAKKGDTCAQNEKSEAPDNGDDE